MPYRKIDPLAPPLPQLPLLPLWGVYTRCTVPMMSIPDAPPHTLIYFAIGGAPYVGPEETRWLATSLARFEEPQRTRFRERTGLDTLAGTVVRIEPGQPPGVRRLTPAEALEFQEAFVASRALEGPALDTHGDPTARSGENVYVGGGFNDRPFQVRYSGTLPYRLVGADAPVWERFLAVLHRLANTPGP